MSLVPEFEVGLLNAWLLTVSVFLSGLLLGLGRKRGRDMSWYSAKEKKIVTLCMMSYFLIILYSIAVPLKFGTMWFIVGFVLYLVGFIALISSHVSFRVASLNGPVTNGIYRVSRNPQYFFGLIAFLGAAIAGLSWFMVFLVIIYSILLHLTILAEERYCLKTYGDSYRKYMNRTPRWIGMSKPKEK